MQLGISLKCTLLATWLTSACLCMVIDGDVLAIKEHLIDELDYILVPTEGWNKLVSWYGLTEAQEPIARKVCLLSVCVCVRTCVCVSKFIWNVLYACASQFRVDCIALGVFNEDVCSEWRLTELWCERIPSCSTKSFPFLSVITVWNKFEKLLQCSKISSS